MNSIEQRFQLKGKTALVTGASSGLGVYFAEVLAAAGATVIVTARRVDRLDALTEKINNSGGKAVTMPCDVSDGDSVTKLMNDSWEQCGGVDILVNNAGIVDSPFASERLPNQEFESVLQTNLNGVWYCCREAGARMLSQPAGGSIINITSVLGMGGAIDHPVGYQVSKAGVINLTRNLACSWADRKVRVNAIAPAYFPSEMTGPYFEVPGYTEFVNEATPMGRTGELSELAGPLLLLASDAGTYITGITLPVDGGYSASVGQSRWNEDIYAGLSELNPEGMKKIRPEGSSE